MNCIIYYSLFIHGAKIKVFPLWKHKVDVILLKQTVLKMLVNQRNVLFFYDSVDLLTFHFNHNGIL